MEISLARALKIKNRLSRDIKNLLAEIQSCNVYVADKQPDVFARQALNQVMELQEQLITLKTDIEKANSAIRNKIFALSEAKAMLSFLNTLNTDVGLYKKIGYGLLSRESDSDVSYVADITRQDVKNLIKKQQLLIDTLQDELDAFNHNTFISVDDSLV